MLSRSLRLGKELLQQGENSAAKLKEVIRGEIEKEPLARIDYVEVVDWNTMEPVERTEGSILVAIAVFIGTTRLIDNFIVE